MVFDAPVVLQRQMLGVGQRRKTEKVPQLQSVQFLEVVDAPVVLMTTGAGVGPDSAENSRIAAVAVYRRGVVLLRTCSCKFQQFSVRSLRCSFCPF